MLFTKISSLLCSIMADAFADLPKPERIEKAVAACALDPRLSARKAAKIYRVAHTTITRRLKQLTKSKKLSHQEQQLLTPVEERTLVKWAIQYYKWGLPLSARHLRQFAVEIQLRKPQPAGGFPPIGEHWHQKLLNRHTELRHVIVRGLDRTRASTVLKKEIFVDYFELYSSLLQQYRILPQDIYNMDEKGFAMGQIQQTRAIVPAAEKELFLRQDGSREWVSVIETISAAGESLSSYIIFKAVY
jgi:helix-turn-helix, Psq domain